MSYSLGAIFEIDLRTRRPPPPPPTPMSDKTALVVGVVGLGIVGLLFWKGKPGGKPTYRRRTRYQSEPFVRVRMNRRRG